MTGASDIQTIQKCIDNSIDDTLSGKRRLAAVIGENPSLYSKSPALWNAAFGALGIEATYLALDVRGSRLGALISTLRDSESLLGFNVTVPHKLPVMEFLDELDGGAKRIQAVNTVVRSPDGRLVGYNTDGAGFIDSLLTEQPGAAGSFIKSLAELDVLMIGAGGSARAIAFHIVDQLTTGRLLICNRTFAHAAALADSLNRPRNLARAILEEELPDWAVRAGLIINSTVKGQGGIRALEDGGVIALDGYSALAPAHPVAVPRLEYEKPGSQDSRAQASRSDISRNNEFSLALARRIPKEVPFYDLIYFPDETVFLRHGRLTGHKAMNGKAMIVCQAARGFFDHICRQELRDRGLQTPESYKRIVETMYRAW